VSVQTFVRFEPRSGKETEFREELLGSYRTRFDSFEPQRSC
jgi:hypothetical protein